jgi:hypothetical protein
MMLRAAGLALFLLATPALADSQLVIDEVVSDGNFYRAVACGAPPGKDCAIPLVRWNAATARDLRVQVVQTDAFFARVHGRRGERALDRAIREINGTGAALSLSRVEAAKAPVKVWFSGLMEGDPITLPGSSTSTGDRMEGARVYIWWNERREIEEAMIVISAGLAADAMESVVLEELTQALGFLTDLEGRAYAETSIFSETSNAVTRLLGQDRMVVRRHYPPDE